eukprot:gene13322-13436_t
MRKALAATLLLAGLMIDQTPARADSQRPVVVELFTSQGCSSCPPADALLTELARNPHVLPLAFHVTYWNNLGWPDPFSLQSATDRQRGYQRTLRSDTIYTPQMIIDGQADVIGSDRPSVENAIKRASIANAVPVDIASRADGISIKIGEGQGAGKILLVGYDSQHRTKVARGENAGRDLAETNIVRSMSVVGSWAGRGITLSSPVPSGEHVAVLVQAEDGRIIGAAR